MDANALSIRRDWMNLAGQFMFQTAIEQLLVHGTKDPEVLKEAFSWGWKEDRNVDEMFADQGEKEVSEWERIRSSWAGLVSFNLIHSIRHQLYFNLLDFSVKLF